MSAFGLSVLLLGNVEMMSGKVDGIEGVGRVFNCEVDRIRSRYSC